MQLLLSMLERSERRDHNIYDMKELLPRPSPYSPSSPSSLAMRRVSLTDSPNWVCCSEISRGEIHDRICTSPYLWCIRTLPRKEKSKWIESKIHIKGWQNFFRLRKKIHTYPNFQFLTQKPPLILTTSTVLPNIFKIALNQHISHDLLTNKMFCIDHQVVIKSC